MTGVGNLPACALRPALDGLRSPESGFTVSNLEDGATHSTRISRPGLALLATLLLSALPAYAQPLIWEASFGPAIASLTGQDDAEDSVVLSFAFPYDNTTYTTVYVGTNGCIQLGSLGTDDDIDYDHWSYFEEFYADAAPEICPINTDWMLTSNGTVHFNDFGTRAVFTWNEVGTNANPDALATFQVQIEQSGRIVFGYNGILDGQGEDLIDDMNQGFVVGITSSDGVDPGPTDLTGGPFQAGGTTYERWCYDLADSCSEGGGEHSAEGALARGSHAGTVSPHEPGARSDISGQPDLDSGTHDAERIDHLRAQSGGLAAALVDLAGQRRSAQRSVLVRCGEKLLE